MIDKEFYSVGEASKMCNISKKALRFYDEKDIIKPDKLCANGYRCYSKETILKIYVVKYFKQMGFKIDEMRDFLEGRNYSDILKAFYSKEKELEAEKNSIFCKFTSVKDWYNLILEAEVVLENDLSNVMIKYIDPEELCFFEVPFNANYKEAIINVPFMQFIEELGNEITGPVIIGFDDYKKRLSGEAEKMKVMQKTILPIPTENTMNFGGKAIATCYHIGPHESLHKTYEKIVKWMEENNYVPTGRVAERYVTDYWTTSDSSKYVTEIQMDMKRLT